MTSVILGLTYLTMLVPFALAEQCHIDSADVKNTCTDQASLLQAQVRVAPEDGEEIVPSVPSGQSSEDVGASFLQSGEDASTASAHQLDEELENTEDVENLETVDSGKGLPTVSDLPPDRIDHDCETIRTIDWEDQENWPEELKRIGALPKPKTDGHDKYVKWTHAYGMPVLGISTFEDVSMRRSCYLARYLFADNEWFRRWSYYSKFYAVGDKGGFCCPSQIGNQGLTCDCNEKAYPIRGQGAPAHEFAHYFINQVLAKMTQRDLLHIPEFVDVPGLNFNYKDTEFMNKDPPDTFTNFLANSYAQDRARGSTQIKETGPTPLHHYFIYTGMQRFINVNAGSGAEREASRKRLHDNNPNLLNLVKEVWPCNNAYIAPCKDDAYGGKLQLAQTLKIGKADPTDPQKMVCHEDLDKAEIPETDVPALAPTPTQDVSTEQKRCLKTIKKKKIWGKKPTQLKTGDVEQLLNPSGDANDHGDEYAWWLRKCCAKTAKFTEAAR